MTSDRKTIAVGLAIAIVFATLGTLIFSNSLETLDVQAERLKIAGENILHSPFPEYTIPGLENVWATILLGIVSTLGIFAVTLIVANLLKTKQHAGL